MSDSMGIDPSAVIHALSVIEPGAVIGAGCRIGPFCHVGPEVVLHANVELKSHVAIAGITEIGEGTAIWPFASIGHQPQDLKYNGERTRLVIGRNNRIREYATLSPGTEGGGGLTLVGDNNLLMMAIHVGHDCRLGNGIVVSNNAQLSGHVVVGDNAVIGGASGVHQYCRIGRGAMVGGMAAVASDVVPYGMVMGERAKLAGLNLVGLKRRGADKDDINGLRAAYREIFESSEGSLTERVEAAAIRHAGNPLVVELTEFLSLDSTRSITLPG
jgi:UDP-N-acetylglucosamine acyltransferase